MNGLEQVNAMKQLAGLQPGDLVDIQVIGRCQVIRSHGSKVVVQTNKGDSITVARSLCKEVRHERRNH